jgi:serine/threonine protein kinase
MPDRFGPYVVEKELGRGAMGVVYQAKETQLGRTVALKIILDSASQFGDLALMRERLLSEARAQAQLSHPGIVAIHSFGESEGCAYIAMEFVEGTTLHARISQTPPDVTESLGILRQVADALDYAHSQRVIHRDIKPENIMLGPGARVRIADFGIAKMLDSTPLTKTGSLTGTLSFMAPERLLGRPADARSDQFSVAVVAYLLLTRHRPFQADSTGALVHKIGADDPPPAHHVNPILDPECSNVLARGLAKNPSDRYESCMAFVGALASALESTHRPAQVRTARLDTDTTRPSRRRGRRRALAAIGVGAAVALALVAIWLLRSQAPQPSTASHETVDIKPTPERTAPPPASTPPKPTQETPSEIRAPEHTAPPPTAAASKTTGQRPEGGGPAIAAKAPDRTPSKPEPSADSELLSLLIPPAIHSGKPTFGVLLESSPADARGIEDSFYGLLNSDKAYFATHLLRNGESREAKALFSRLYAGDEHVLGPVMAQLKVGHLVIGRIEYSIRKQPDLDADLRSCDMTLTYKVADRDAIIKNDRISVTGAGFGNQAVERSLEMLADRFRSAVLQGTL